MSKWYVEGRIAMDGEPYYLVTDGSGDDPYRFDYDFEAEDFADKLNNEEGEEE